MRKMTENQNVFLNVNKVSKRFWRDGAEFAVLNDVSLSLAEGEFFVLLGRSGCGKTTLLRCIGGFLTPEEGEIFLEGKKVEQPSAERMMVFQDFNQLFPWMTLGKNLTYAMKKVNPKESKEKCEQRAMEFLAAAGLSGFENQYPSALSGGMKQRGALARALALNPKLLLMDEATGGLDVVFRREFYYLLQEAVEKEMVSVIISTHVTEDLDKVADYVAFMEGGRMKFYESKEELSEMYHDYMRKLHGEAAGGGTVKLEDVIYNYDNLMDRKGAAKE